MKLLVLADMPAVDIFLAHNSPRGVRGHTVIEL